MYSFSSLSTGVYTLKSSARGYSGYTVLNLLVDSAAVSEDMQMDPNFTADDLQDKEPIAALSEAEDKQEIIVADGSPAFVSPNPPTSANVETTSTAKIPNVDQTSTPLRAQVSIYPNPVYDNASIEIGTDTDIEGGIIRVYDIFGTEVRRFPFTGKTAVFERAGLGTGVYVYQINAANQSIATGKMLLL
jgi:hypothetical protein